MVNAIKEADTLVKRPISKKIPPLSSAPFARNAISSGIGKCSSSPNHFSKNVLSSGWKIISITEGITRGNHSITKPYTNNQQQHIPNFGPVLAEFHLPAYF